MAKRRKRVGAMSTTTTLLLVGGGALLLFMVMGKSTTTPAIAPGATYVPTNTAANNLAITNANNTANTQQAVISDTSDTVNNLINSIFT
jgi:hypothetical protein